MLKKNALLLIILCIDYCWAIDNNTFDGINGIYLLNMLQGKKRNNLVTFEALGQDIKLGLKFQLPFLKLPIERKVDASGNKPALININTAALVSMGLLVSAGTLVSWIFRRYVVLQNEEKSRRSDNNFHHYFGPILNNFKLVYSNSSGARVGDTSLDSLIDVLTEAFENNGFNLSSCISKVICTRIQISARHIHEGNASGVDKIIYGLMDTEWWKDFLRHTSLNDAMDFMDALSLSNHHYNETYCNDKYPQCKWSQPEDQITAIVRNYIKLT